MKCILFFFFEFLFFSCFGRRGCGDFTVILKSQAIYNP